MLIHDETFQLYIGDAQEHHLEGILRLHVDGYTMVRTMGYWKGQTEDSIVVTVSTNRGAAVRLAKDLAARLNQEAIGLVRVGDAMEFVS